MIALSNYNNLTPEEYLQFEETSPIKHEYIDGQVYSMAGTTDTHNIVAGNIYTIIRNHLRGANCRVYFAAQNRARNAALVKRRRRRHRHAVCQQPSQVQFWWHGVCDQTR